MKVGFNNNLSSMNAFQQKKSGTSIPFGLTGGLKDNNFKDKTANVSPSFTGMNYGKLTGFISGLPNAIQKGYDSLFLKEVAVVPDLQKLVRESNSAIGEGFLSGRLKEFQKLYGSRSSNFIEVTQKNHGERVVIRDRSFAGKIIHGLVETAKFPLDAVCAISNFLSENRFTRNLRPVIDLSNSKLITNRKNEKAGEELFYRLKGIMSYQDVSKLQRDILKVPEGKPVGNYAPKSERALNRLITGFVSSLFVGMDFFNLTMYNTNDKDKASEAGKRRFGREMSRIGLNAFLTYAVLGAFSNFASRSKAVACGLIAGTSLVSEVLTRILYGTPLVPLSSEGAKKYNQKRATKMGKAPQFSSIPKTPETLPNVTPTPIFLTSTAPKVFDPFTKMRSGSYQQQTPFAGFMGYTQPAPALQNQPVQVQGTEQKEGGKKKKLLSAKNIGFTIIALNLIYGVARSKSPAFEQFNKLVKQQGKDLYNKIAKRQLVVPQEELRKFLSGFEGQGLEHIQSKYSRLISDLRFTDAERAILTSDIGRGKITINPADITNEKTRVFFKALREAAMRKVDAELLAKAAKNPTFDIAAARADALNEINELFGRHAVKDGKVVPNLDVSRFAHNAKSDEFDKIVSNLNVESISFNVKRAGSHFAMTGAEYNFGRIANTPILKGVADAVVVLKDTIASILTLPLTLLDMLAGKSKMERLAETTLSDIEKNRKIYPDLGELYKDCSAMYGRFKKGEISKKAFSDYLAGANTKFLNKDTTPSYPQTALASVSRNLVTAISSYFFINDFRNEVLIQSNGENTEKAKEVTKEKFMHKACNFVFNKCFMEFFNHAGEPLYLGSLPGATLIAGLTEVTNESSIRASIGIPLTMKQSKEAIEEYEKKHMEAKGFKGWYFRFIAKVTGKKRLSEKAEGDKK